MIENPARPFNGNHPYVQLNDRPPAGTVPRVRRAIAQPYQRARTKWL
jgi:hypothetical protein